MMKVYIILITVFLVPSLAVNTKLLNVEPYHLSGTMKNFMNRISQENCQKKAGFLLVVINKIEYEYIDFAVQKLTENSTVIIMNLYVDINVNFRVNPSHFKFVLADPEGDLTYADEVFKKVGVSRARTALILVKKPSLPFINYILNSYWKIKCVNIIIAFEYYGEIEIITYNPYLPSQRVENLANSSEDLFYDKTKNLHGFKIRCLLPYLDRTKIRKVIDYNGVHYEGKDYTAILTILSQINGELELVTMENILLNPWFESVDLGNRSQRKKTILEQKDISILLKSERFTNDDEVLDNLYPHTQNDLSILVPKSSEIPVSKSMLMIFTASLWLTNIAITFVLLLLWVIIKNIFGIRVNIQRVYFNIWRIIITNNLVSLPERCGERLLVISWILTSFLINIFLQSQVTSYLAIRTYYPEIDTIEELFSSGLPLYSINIHIEEIQKKYAGTPYEAYAQSLTVLASNEGLMDQMTYRADVTQMPVFFTEYDLALFVSRCNYLRKDGGQAYHLVKESIIPSYQSYKVVHNSPLLPVLNEKLRRLSEGGFIELWAKKVIFNATIEGFLSPDDIDDVRSDKPLSLEESFTLFYILFFGYSLSCVIFVIEMIFHMKT